MGKYFFCFFRLILMHLKETSHLLWTWKEWEKVRYGWTVRALVDTGRHLQPVTVIIAATQEHTNQTSACPGVVSLHRDTTMCRDHGWSLARICWSYSRRLEETHQLSLWLKDQYLQFVLKFLNHHHPNIKNWHLESYGKGQTFHRPKVHLKWSPGQAISAIKFASFGTPLGKCGRYQQGECHAATSYAILERVRIFTQIKKVLITFFGFITVVWFCYMQKCVGKARCAVTISNTNFGKDPCPNVLKRLTVEAVCSPETSITSWKPWKDDHWALWLQNV